MSARPAPKNESSQGRRPPRPGALVAVVGRPNVGKSALVNRLSALQTAIVHPLEGVTRDRNYVHADWRNREFTIIDTGGIAPGEEDTVAAIRRQALLAVDEADVILMIVDRTAGITPGDQEVADILRKSRKPLLLVVNKVDDPHFHEQDKFTFYELGLGDPQPVSALHGIGTGDLLDAVVELLPEPEEEGAEGAEAEGAAEAVSVAIIGRPNVGKSSLLNKLLGQERAVVSPVPGTTRDAIDSLIEHEGRILRLVDTAGVRKKGRGAAAVEYYGWVRTVRALERAELALLMIDAAQGATEMDQKVAELAAERRCAVIVVVNKWDLLKGDPDAQRRCQDSIERRLWFFPHAPYVNLSALTGKGLARLYPLILDVAGEYQKQVGTSPFNRLLEEIKKTVILPSKKGKQLKVDYGTQVRTAPPSFLIFCNDRRLATPAFKAHLEKRIRERFGFLGCPIMLTFRDSK